MPPPRRCYERRRTKKVPGRNGAVAGPTSGTAAAPPRRPAWWNPDCCLRRESCSSAENPRWANLCWSPISPCRWRPARTAPAFPSPRRAVCWSASSNFPSRSSSAAWPPCGEAMGTAADQNLLVDTRATGHLLSAPQGLNHFLSAAQCRRRRGHRPGPALLHSRSGRKRHPLPWRRCASRLLRLRDASRAALIVVHHVRKSITPLRDRQRLPRLQRPACRGRQLHAAHQTLSPTAHRRTALPVPLRRCAAAATARTRSADSVVFLRPASRRPLLRPPGAKWKKRTSHKLWRASASRRAITNCASKSWTCTECSKRTAQLAITEACQQGWIVQDNGQYRLPL